LLCSSGSRKEQSQQKTSPDTLTAPTSSASRISLRRTSSKVEAKPCSSPEMPTPSPLPPPPLPTHLAASEYVPPIPKTQRKEGDAPKGKPEPLPPSLPLPLPLPLP
ncbi:hypothetical protein PMAYCL1PPCAC_23490, partial [Pristionchus mayeri]